MMLTACTGCAKANKGNTSTLNSQPYSVTVANEFSQIEGELTQEKVNKYTEELFGDKNGCNTVSIQFGITNIRADVPILKDSLSENDGKYDNAILYHLSDCNIEVSVCGELKSVDSFEQRVDEYIKEFCVNYQNYDVYKNSDYKNKDCRVIKVSCVNDDGKALEEVIKLCDINGFTFVVRVEKEKGAEIDSSTLVKICNLYKIDLYGGFQ